ncbi:hypothetical protein BFR91_08605 [Acinetobacter pittii]|nr:hypothetical protein BFR91_08605 [Acinetobacter pittii]
MAILFGSVLHTAHAGFFDDYNQTAQSFRANITLPIPEETHKFLEKKVKGSDAALYLLEKGRLQQANHQYEESKKSFETAFVLLEQRNNKAKISASELGFKALSLVSNDSVIPYKIPEYEQVLAHVYQAINFMALNNPESAGVEMRIAQRIQREIELAHTKEAEKAKEKAGPDNNQSFDEAFAGLDTIAGKVKNTYQNAYAFYMAATLWEALGEENDALVDFKKAYELQPNDFIKNDVKRLDMSSGKKSQQYPVVIFLEQGLVPQKIPNTFALPTPNGLINVSFASYNPSTYKSPTSLQVFVNGRPMTNTSTLTDIGALAVKTLKENVAANMTSQIARTTAKYMVQKELGNHLGAIGQIAGNIYNTASEKADVRAWNTLPSNAQVARLTLPTGTHTIQLKNGYMTQELNIDVKPNQTVFIHGIEANQEILTDSFAITH